MGQKLSFMFACLLLIGKKTKFSSSHIQPVQPHNLLIFSNMFGVEWIKIAKPFCLETKFCKHRLILPTTTSESIHLRREVSSIAVTNMWDGSHHLHWFILFSEWLCPFALCLSASLSVSLFTTLSSPPHKILKQIKYLFYRLREIFSFSKKCKILWLSTCCYDLPHCKDI